MNNSSPPQDQRKNSGLRHACELAAGVLMVCILTRAFLVEGLIVPVLVSGGSMAETILGPRCEVTCPECGITFACGIERWPASNRAVCLNCGAKQIDLNTGHDFTGQHVLVDRSAFQFRWPRRWETIVFQCPEQAGTLCIKRVVGLPGETVELRAGDVYINGEIARKDPAECRAMAQLVHDAAYVPEHPSADAPGWRESGPTPRWRSTEPGTFFHERKATTIRQEIPAAAWLDFHPGHDRPLTDNDPYNQGDSRRLNRVTDHMLTCRIKAEGPGELILASDDGQTLLELELSPGRHWLSVKQNQRVDLDQTLPELPWATGVDLELIRFDQKLWLSLGQQVVVKLPLQPRASKGLTNQESRLPLRIAGHDLQVEVSRLRVLRDVYYTVPPARDPIWGAERPALLGPGELFVLGDNSPISADSRTLAQPGVSCKSLIGKPLFFW